MAEITVRKIRFTFDGSIDFGAMSDEDLGRVLPMLGLSMTMPYLEPYLIRTMKVALERIGDESLAEDTRRFSQQEGHHYRNHMRFNDQIRNQFDAAAAEKLRGIETDLERDYRKFTKERSLRFNLGYAEGFEAMTCAIALASAEHRTFGGDVPMPGGEIWAWHMAEEIEHRTVAFDVYEHLVGSYPYRILRGTWAQWHYVSYIMRFARCMAGALGREMRRTRSPEGRTVLRNYLRTWSPRYDPAKIPLPPGVAELLAHYSEVAGNAA
jgi:predicted metal-dependent hydrolase